MKISKFITLIIVAFTMGMILSACGDPMIEVPEDQYEPKIVMEAFIYPGETVKDIKISRNFRINQEIDSDNLILLPDANQVEVSINDIPLEFDPTEKTWFNNSILVESEKTYTINIKATIEGLRLQATSTTTVPSAGFQVIEENLGVVKYPTPLFFNFKPTQGCEIYLWATMADSASLDNFIYDNIYFPDIDREDLEKGFNGFRFQQQFMINVDANLDGNVTKELLGLDTWFYSTYTVFFYAGDKNFKDYQMTAKRSQQFDGNFVEPLLNIEGDGIGVFASALKDTMYFEIIP